MNDLTNTTVLVLGLGESGLAMARWCARLGAGVRVWDSREQPANTAALAAHVPGAQWVRGPLTDAAFAGVAMVLKSPGLSPQDERIASMLNRAADTGVPVRGELDLFARALADLKAARGYAPKVLAVTGTNGKTTTTAMAAMLIARTGKRVAVAGNIGPTMLQTLADALDREPQGAAAMVACDGPHLQCASWLASQDRSTGSAHASRKPRLAPSPLPEGEGEGAGAALPCFPEGDRAAAGAALPSPSGRGIEGEGGAERDTPTESPADDSAPIPLPPAPPAAPVFEHLPEVWVLELSSFQLDEVQGFEPSAATILNITQDHLDWHGSMAHYIAAKARVFGRHAVMVINRDDPLVEGLVPAPETVKGARGRKATTIERAVVRFGLGAPRRPGDFGVVEEHGIAWLVRARELDETLGRGHGGKGAGSGSREAEELLIQRLMP
ncbi:MAG: UDP-N-acetylmuramoyl-L-alanine--D-glutamate ligase, partial [Burkholderiales bacterium]|nr:UDP-N-acetylmuramoyl-L-alanine--D-glutamate ligase [Burkholderiales bacterium]